MLMTGDQVDELLSVLADLSELDEELVERCGFLIRTERYDEAVGRAFVVLEERMRVLLGTSGGAGRHLVNKLFSSRDTRFTDRLYRSDQEVAGLRAIFEGSFAAFRNRAAHTVAGYKRDEARAIIHLVNMLLLIVEQIRKAPDLQVELDIANALSPAAGGRLQHFLARLQEIGVSRKEGDSSDAYKVTLICHYPSWERPRPYEITVFYLQKEGNPSLRFRIDMLSKVKGYDIDALKDTLVEIGCKRSVRKTTPLELFVTERTDQITFDRLYETIKDLVLKHSPA
jgi:uncharacterized protein (TIGR02391 family)